jgi:hypothetical protein
MDQSYFKNSLEMIFLETVILNLSFLKYVHGPINKKIKYKNSNNFFNELTNIKNIIISCFLQK